MPYFSNHLPLFHNNSAKAKTTPHIFNMRGCIIYQSRGFIVGTSARQMLYRTIVFHISPFRHSSRTFSDALMSYRFISFHPIPCVCCSNCCSRLRPQRHTLWNSKRIYNKGISLDCQAIGFQLYSAFLRNHSLLRS